MRIKVMPDHASSGLWDADEGGMIDFEEVSDLPEFLKLRIEKWLKLYTKICPNGDWVSDFAKLELINSETMMIGVQLKKLHPEWHIECWLEQQRCSVDIIVLELKK